jgi:hypothetical protein
LKHSFTEITLFQLFYYTKAENSDLQAVWDPDYDAAIAHFQVFHQQVSVRLPNCADHDLRHLSSEK